MFTPETFVPSLFIGIGETSAYFTLRETYLHTVYIRGEGAMGNAVVNGVYQGTVEHEVRSYHIKNLSQDADEAMAKAKEAADSMGLKLLTKVEDIREEMRDIKRANAEEMERRARVQAERQAQWDQERAEIEQAKRDMIMSGKFGFGRFHGMEFKEAGAGYLNWLMKSVSEFEEGSLMRLTAEQVLGRCSDVLLPEPKSDVSIGEIKQRLVFDVTVIRVIDFISYDYWGNAMTKWVNVMVDAKTGGCVTYIGNHLANVGEKIKVKATVKAHEEYRGVMQTMVNRPAVM